MSLLTIAITFTCLYLLELPVFGIGAFKEGGGRGFEYCFLAVLLILWIGFLMFRKRNIQYKNAGFVAFGLILSLWIVPAWRIEIRVEEYEDRKINELFRRIEVDDVRDERFLSPQGLQLGVRMRYSVRFPKDGDYAPTPYLQVAEVRGMWILGAQISPPPEKTHAAPMSGGIYARYKGNVTYAFVVDLVPMYLIFSHDRTRSCMAFLGANERNTIATNGQSKRFTVHINGTGYGGYYGGPSQFTQNAYSPKEFYQGAIENGAKEGCVFNSRGDLQ